MTIKVGDRVTWQVDMVGSVVPQHLWNVPGNRALWGVVRETTRDTCVAETIDGQQFYMSLDYVAALSTSEAVAAPDGTRSSRCRVEYEGTHAAAIAALGDLRSVSPAFVRFKAR